MRRILMMFVLLTLLCAVGMSAADTARERKLQQGIELLETKGDVARAVTLFEDVAKSSDKALAARGLLHLGHAQERQGANRARATYEKILRDFSNQKELVAEAQRRLSALGEGGMRAYRIPHGSEIGFSNVSRDGEWLGGTDWNKGDVVMMRVKTGEIRRVVAGGGPNIWGEDPVVSPDGRLIAFSWYPEDSKGETLNHLGLVANEPNARPRVLLDKPGQYQNFYPVGWARDGKSLLISFEILPSRNFQMAWISVDDGTVRVIHETERWRNSGGNSIGIRLSPDGKFLLYSARTSQESDETAIYILSSDGGTAVELIRNGINESPIWTSDGGRVLFISDQRSGHFDLWSVPVRDGKRTGAASIAKEDIGRVSAFGISPAGTYLYGFRAGLQQVLVSEMDRSGAQARDAAKLIEGFVGHSPRWSRDGKWIAFKQRITTFDKQHLILHSMETGAKWTIRPNTLGWGVPQWFLDGSVQPSGQTLRVSVSSGEPKEFTAPRALSLAGALSPDDKRIYVLASEGQTSGINVIDTATGERREFLKMPVGFRSGDKPIAVSPDGGTLAIRTTNGIARMGVDGASFREILTVDSADGGLNWTRDGRYILFTQRNGTGSRIMRVPAGGGQLEFTGIGANDRIQQFDLSPDGSRLAYAVNSSRWEDWALENVSSAWGER